MRFNRLAALAVAFLFAAPLAAQQTGTVTGRVTADGQGLQAVQVVLTSVSSGAQYGGLTNADGRYNVINVRPGAYEIGVVAIGYTTPSQGVVVVGGQSAVVDFAMTTQAVDLAAIEVFATRAKTNETPVAFSDVRKVQIQNQLGSRDLPLVLNVTPSVYSTAQGGGAGDARVNVRGFSQRNTAVMINGVPVNDMENGWVYWSNWDGLGDAATSIQLQRGLSAVNLATPSIGGTLNIITDPTRAEAGYTLKQEFGSGSFLKTTLSASTGNMGRWALTATGVKKTGDGLVDGVWTDAYSYYLASSFQVNDRNRLEAYLVGAPQRHGQRLYKLNIATFDQDFARSLKDYDPQALAEFPQAGIKWSPNLGSVSSSYTGQQFASTGPGSGTFSRYDRGFLNERENYFSKPQFNLNWYSYLGDGLNLSTVAYYSGGQGGGTGTYGSLVWDYRYTQRFPDWDGTIARNASSTGQVSRGILRNSVNNQDTWGAIAKLRKDFQSDWTGEFGLDARTATIEHYREVRDLLGGVAYNDCFRGCSSEFWNEAAGEGLRGLGDKINYHNENQVKWIGAHLQAQRTTQAGSFYAMTGVSMISYNFTDFFKRSPTNASDFLTLESGNLYGSQVKGGVVRNVTEEWSLYGNAGYVSKVPIFDGVIDDVSAILNDDPKNETFRSFEVGARFRSADRGVSLDANIYHTTWKNRTRNQFVRNLFGDNQDGLVNLLGVNARHMGIEVEGAWQPNAYVRFDAAASIGDWIYTDNVTGQIKQDDRLGNTEIDDFYIKDLYVGDAPQQQLAYGLSVFPIEGFFVQAVGKSFGKHYAEYDPFDRTDQSEEGIQSWQAPGYTLFDLHAAYNFGRDVPALRGNEVRIFLNVFNLFDKVYIQDAVDNSRFNSYDQDHDADDAEVFVGFPRSVNIGIQISR